MRLTFYVAPRQDGAFLRDVLRQNGVSAALSASVKHCGGFFADGVPTRANQRVAAGAAVSFELPPEADTSVIPEDVPLSIVYEDEHAMVLEKPAGMAVHPRAARCAARWQTPFAGFCARGGKRACSAPSTGWIKAPAALCCAP